MNAKWLKLNIECVSISDLAKIHRGTKLNKRYKNSYIQNKTHSKINKSSRQP